MCEDNEFWILDFRFWIEDSYLKITKGYKYLNLLLKQILNLKSKIV